MLMSLQISLIKLSICFRFFVGSKINCRGSQHIVRCNLTPMVLECILYFRTNKVPVHKKALFMSGGVFLN